MGNNPSVRQFKLNMKELTDHTKDRMRDMVFDVADELVGNIKNAAPKDTGALASSVRWIDVSKYGQPSVLVVAGGSKTIKRSSTGHAYDYSEATEFGTRKETAEPFFYTTYRAYKNPAREFYQQTLDEIIQENNQIRAGNGFSDGVATVTYGREGRTPSMKDAK